MYYNFHRCIQNFKVPLTFVIRAILHLNILILLKIPCKGKKSKETFFFYSQVYLHKIKVFFDNKMCWNAHICPHVYTMPSYIDCVYDTLGCLICTFPINLSPLGIFSDIPKP